MSTAASDLPGAKTSVDRGPLRFVTAASLFDGHDAAINIMRRLIQAQGAEVIHLGHNRSVDDIVREADKLDALEAVCEESTGHFPAEVLRQLRIARRNGDDLSAFIAGVPDVPAQWLASEYFAW